MKKIFYILIITFLIIEGVFIWGYFHYQIPVLMYHSIDEKCSKYSTLCVSPQRFKEQMEFIKRRGYKVLTIQEYISLINKPVWSIPHNLVLITFDDGYKNNFTYAYPVLKRLGFPACIFMVAAKVNQKDRLSAQQLKILSQNGITIGSHTLTERYLPHLTEEEIEIELCTSKKILEEITGKKIIALCYPTGGFNKSIQKIAQKCGYKIAFTTNRGYKVFPQDIFAIRRIKITQKDNNFILFFKLSGWYNLFRRIRNPS